MRAEHDRQRNARRRIARCQFKATQVGSEHDEPVALGQGLLDNVPVLTNHLSHARIALKPDARQFAHHCTGFCCCLPRKAGLFESSLRGIALEMVAISARYRIDDPTERASDAMDHRQWQRREQPQENGQSALSERVTTMHGVALLECVA